MIQHSKPVFVLMPQWQGSSASRAMLLIDGAAHLRQDLPQSALLDVNVPIHAGDALGTPIARLSAILAARDAVREMLVQRAEPAITLGGDSASTLAGLERASSLDPGVALLWFDARPRLEHPSTSPSGAAAGMVLRHILGDGVTDLAFPTPVSPDRILLIGTRDVEPDEEQTISELGLRWEPGVDESTQEEVIQDWLVSLGATSVYVHVALDVLDPADFASLHTPVPFGMSVAGLTAAIRAAVGTLPLAGATISEFAPADDEMANSDAPTVLRILAALLSGGGQ